MWHKALRNAIIKYNFFPVKVCSLPFMLLLFLCRSFPLTKCHKIILQCWVFKTFGFELTCYYSISEHTALATAKLWNYLYKCCSAAWVLALSLIAVFYCHAADSNMPSYIGHPIISQFSCTAKINSVLGRHHAVSRYCLGFFFSLIADQESDMWCATFISPPNKWKIGMPSCSVIFVQYIYATNALQRRNSL